MEHASLMRLQKKITNLREQVKTCFLFNFQNTKILQKNYSKIHLKHSFFNNKIPIKKTPIFCSTPALCTLLVRSNAWPFNACTLKTCKTAPKCTTSASRAIWWRLAWRDSPTTSVLKCVQCSVECVWCVLVGGNGSEMLKRVCSVVQSVVGVFQWVEMDVNGWEMLKRMCSVVQSLFDVLQWADGCKWVGDT